MGVFRQILETIVGFIHRNPLLFLLLVVLAIGMPGLFGVLAFVLAIPALIILIMACLLGWQLLRLHRRSEEAFGSQTRDFRDNGSKRREGDVTIVRTDRDSKRVSEKVGEYVDYKEVKEKK